MIELDPAGVAALNAVAKRADQKKKPDWQPLDLATLQPGTYLAADPSLTAFGLVLFEVASEQRYTVHMATAFRTVQVASGHEDTLLRTELLQAQLEGWLGRWLVGHDWGHLYAVHESPPIGQLRHSKFEISLLTGYAFRAALTAVLVGRSELSLLPMVRRQDHARLICGDPNADKKLHHAALKEHFDAIGGADEWITNEATRDALACALYAAKRGPR